jgi:glycosyltransferase involved in cell wall biosynthesis
MRSTGTSGRTIVSTIVSKNYLHFARTLMASLRRVQPDWEQCVLLVDKVQGEFDPHAEPFEVLPVTDLPLPQRQKFFFRYTILELNTAVKPWLLQWLFETKGADRVVYLDPDIYVYRPLREVEKALDAGALMVLTPHLTGALDDGHCPSEQDVLITGSYNLGFIALGRHPRLEDFLSWWQGKLEYDCRVDFVEGLFTDQKWLDLAPGMFEDVHILRHDGYNVAYWNLKHRRLARGGVSVFVNGQPLVFFHFSGLNPRNPTAFSRYQDRYRLEDLGPARDLVRAYCQALSANGQETCSQWTYAFGSYGDGRRIPDLHRYYYRKSRAVQDWAGDDPFRNRPTFRSLFRPDLLIRALTLGLTVCKARLRPFLKPLLPGAVRERLKATVRLMRLIDRKAARAEAANGPLDPLRTRGPNLQLVKETQPGLNIVGYIRSEHGVGQGARACAQAAAAVGLHFSMHDFNVGNRSRSTDKSWAHKLAVENVHHVNLFHVNADQMPVAHAAFGSSFFAGHYNIGYWAWELPEFPDQWRPSFHLVDEVWVPSQFVLDAISRKSPVPVVCMPHAIHCEIDPRVRRSAFGLPQDPFLFLTMYDTCSIQARKNPWGVIEAFQTAFPHTKDVALVVKINNAPSAPREVKALRDAVTDIPGVHLLDATLSRQEVYNLEAVCDCFVSLHRAEGFGLGLAESMFLGKPVIGTGWSGNVDFMNSDNSCPVRYELVALEKDHGPYRQGQTWAEPDLDHAVWFMRKVIEERSWRELLAARGQHTIQTRFSPRAIGEWYRRRLQAIFPRSEGGPNPPAQAA